MNQRRSLQTLVTYVAQTILLFSVGIVIATTTAVSLSFVDDQFRARIPYGQMLALGVSLVGFGLTSAVAGLLRVARKIREQPST